MTYRRHRAWLLWAAACLTALTAFGCPGAGEQDDADSRRMQEIRVLQRETEALRKENSALQSACQDLKTERDNLAVTIRELEQWHRKLIESIGPSVWTLGTYEKPVLYKTMKKKATAEELADALNAMLRSNGLPTVTLVSVNGGTARLHIDNARVLADRMGTTGAASFMNAVAYTFSSLESIQCVDFEIPAGSHAVPGRLCP